MTDIRWGILGTGNIARQFSEGLKALPDAQIAAVGSRSAAKAEDFGTQFNAPRRHGSYEALAADPEVDIIYVATPHSLHCENALLCLNHGKAVLCEKPFMINAAQAREVIAAARSRGIFLMEAMWSRFFPLIDRVQTLIAEGAIGDLVFLQADFGFRADFNPASRIFNPELGGGALLDVGVYPISLASLLFGTPDSVSGWAQLGQSGVDEAVGIVLGYGAGRAALIATTVRANTAQEALLTGTKGRLKIHAPWWRPSSMTLSVGGKDEVINVPFESNGYQYEAAEAMRCLREGKTESNRMPLDETLSILETMDTLRRQWGLRYPTLE